MKRKSIRIMISLLLVLSLSVGVLAVNPNAMTDISGHWARDDIRYCLEQGLFTGTSATTFEPNKDMSRGMFVTVLGRVAGVGQNEYGTWCIPYLYSDVSVDKYYAPYIAWATRCGIVNGIGGGKFAPDAPVTREQMAKIIAGFADIYGYSLTRVSSTISPRFTDSSSISSWAADAVESMRLSGILNGYPDGRFGPKDTATRAMCAKVFHLVKTSMVKNTANSAVFPTGLQVSPSSLDLKPGDTSKFTATVIPSNTTVDKTIWFSTNPAVASVDENGNVTAKAAGICYVYAMTCNDNIYCTVNVKSNQSLTYAGESEYDKCIRLFGKYLTESQRDSYYLGTGGKHVAAVRVPVWQFTDSSHTTKQTSYITLYVHMNLVDTVRAIFTDIYNGPEKFPIYSAGGYRDERGEHGAGMAIDINAHENGEFVYSGGTLVPTANWFWAPGENPYSIPANGDVVKAFKKYGWGWGGEWRSKRDYMHFSYFHT